MKGAIQIHCLIYTQCLYNSAVSDKYELCFLTSVHMNPPSSPWPWDGPGHWQSTHWALPGWGAVLWKIIWGLGQQAGQEATACPHGRGYLEQAIPRCMSGGRVRAKNSSFSLGVRKNLFSTRTAGHWSRLPRESVQSPCLGVFKTQLEQPASELTLL